MDEKKTEAPNKKETCDRICMKDFDEYGKDKLEEAYYLLGMKRQEKVLYDSEDEKFNLLIRNALPLSEEIQFCKIREVMEPECPSSYDQIRN